MSSQRLVTLLLCLGLLLEQGAGFVLRKSRNAKLDDAFQNLRDNFAKNHPGWAAEHALKLSTETKSVTPAPFDQNLLQLNAAHKVAPVSTTSNKSGDVLFSVYTDSLFYDTRLTGIMETWAKEIATDRFMAISDKARPGNRPGNHVEETQCPPHSHWEGACCKWAEGVILAQQKMERDSSLKWAFFSDDDVYLLPHAVADALHKVENADKPQALGIFGCTTPTGCSGLCGGGGFAINRAAVQRLAGKDPAEFLQEEMQMCQKCQWWADQAISMIWADKGIEMKQLRGLNGWIMQEDAFKAQLNQTNLLFHYQRTKNQMEALHEIFTGERLLKKENGPCVEYKGHKTCAASANKVDVPFLLNPNDPGYSVVGM